MRSQSGLMLSCHLVLPNLPNHRNHNTLGDDLTVEVMFILGFFSLEGNPQLCMRVFYCSYVLYVYYLSEEMIERL